MIAAVVIVAALCGFATFLLWINGRAHCHDCHRWFRFRAGQARAAWVYHYEFDSCERSR